MSKRARTLQSFSKEALIAFIKANVGFHERWEKQLIDIEAQQRYDKLKAEVDECLAKMKDLAGASNYKKWKANSDQIDACWAEMDALSTILYPGHAPFFQRKGANNEATRG